MLRFTEPQTTNNTENVVFGELTVRLGMEDEHGDGGGRREGLGDQHELLGGGEGG